MKKTVILKPSKPVAEESYKVGSVGGRPVPIEFRKGMARVLSLSSKPGAELLEVQGKGRIRKISRKSLIAAKRSDRRVTIEVSRDWAELAEDLQAALKAFQQAVRIF
jgi:hypothetical protein